MFFPTLTVGLLDFKVYVVLARPAPDCSAQLRVSLQCPPTAEYPSKQCPTAEYPCSAQPQSIPASSAQPQSIPAVPNHKVSQQCPTAEYPSSAQPQSIPAVPNRTQSIPAVPNRRVSLQCPTAEYPCSARPQSISIVPNRRVSTFRASFTADTCSTLSLEVVKVALERRRVKSGDVRSRYCKLLLFSLVVP